MSDARTIPLAQRVSLGDGEAPNLGPPGVLVPLSQGRSGQLLITPVDGKNFLIGRYLDAGLAQHFVSAAGDEGGAQTTIAIPFAKEIGDDARVHQLHAVPWSASPAVADVTSLATAANLRLSDGTNMVSGRALADDADNQTPLAAGLIAAIARLQAFDGTNYDRLRIASAANVAAQSGAGAQLVAQPGHWSINHTPVANTQATITRAAGAAGVRHVCTSISCTLIGLAAAAETTVLINLRDGASGAGTILWSQRLQVIPGGTTGIALSGLNIVGSAATAMTLEFAAAGGADTFESVALTGFDVS